MGNSRVLKFRAWDGKKMHNEIALDCEGKAIRNGYQWFSAENTIYHSPVMQYTGLKDKNGKEIYEEDIVVYYNNCEEVRRELVEWAVQGFNMLLVTSDYEVIGNIYESPELLEDV